MGYNCEQQDWNAVQYAVPLIMYDPTDPYIIGLINMDGLSVNRTLRTAQMLPLPLPTMP